MTRRTGQWKILGKIAIWGEVSLSWGMEALDRAGKWKDSSVISWSRCGQHSTKGDCLQVPWDCPLGSQLSGDEPARGMPNIPSFHFLLSFLMSSYDAKWQREGEVSFSGTKNKSRPQRLSTGTKYKSSRKSIWANPRVQWEVYQIYFIFVLGQTCFCISQLSFDRNPTQSAFN